MNPVSSPAKLLHSRPQAVSPHLGLELIYSLPDDLAGLRLRQAMKRADRLKSIILYIPQIQEVTFLFGQTLQIGRQLILQLYTLYSRIKCADRMTE